MLIVPHMDAIAKFLTMHKYHVLQVAWLRMATQLGLVMPIACWVHGARAVALSPRRPFLLLRGCFLLGTTICFFGALEYLPLADAVAITFIEPVFLLIFSAAVLRERVSASRVVASLVGFGAVMLIVKPGSSAFRPAALVALLAACFFSLYLLTTRQLQLGHAAPPRLVLLAYQCVPGAVLLAACLPFVWTPFAAPAHLALGLAMGAIGAVSHALLICAFSLSEASMLAPLLYTEIIMQTVLGYVVWGDLPDALALCGIVVIIGVGVFLGCTEGAGEEEGGKATSCQPQPRPLEELTPRDAAQAECAVVAKSTTREEAKEQIGSTSGTSAVLGTHAPADAIADGATPHQLGMISST